MAIHTFIKAQAGSLGKALSESVMNSFDAFATSVEITLDRRGFVVSDDGQGFRDKNEIASWFETLGFPHDDGNHRQWGKFGMGRAQAWAYASTVWESNTFRMSVDVQRKGLDYELDIGTPYKGTRITGTFYTPLDTAEVISVERELSELIKYVTGPVYLNGKLVTQDPSLKEWAQETDDAWMDIKAARSGSLAVYNAGVLVRSFSAYQFNVEGVIVTKPDRTLELNLARNEILVSSCSVWARIRKSFPKLDDKKAEDTKPKHASKKTLEVLGLGLKSGEVSLKEAFEASYDLLRDVGGRALDLNYLVHPYRMRPVTVMPKGTEAGKRLMKLRKAYVIAQESLDALGLSFEELEALVKPYGLEKHPSVQATGWGHRPRGYEECLVDNPWKVDARELFPDFFAGRVQLKMDELQPHDRAAYAALSYSWRMMHTALREVCKDEETRKRVASLSSIVPGDSPDTQFWVEDNMLVVRHKELVGLQRSFGEAGRFNLRLLRAFVGAVVESDAEANDLFIKVVTETKFAGEFTSEVVRRYVNKCRAEKLELSSTAISAVSSAESLDGALDDEETADDSASPATAAAM